MNKIANKDLRDSIELLARKAFAFYNHVVSQYPPVTDTTQLFLIIEKFETEIQNWDEYKRCIEVVNADVTISALLEKLVGTMSEQTTVGDANLCVTRLVYQLYLLN